MNVDEQLIEAAKSGQLKEVRELVDQGADVNQGEITSSMWAYFNGHHEIAKYLLEHGGNINHDRFEEGTLLTFSAFNGDLEFLRYLIEAGASVNHSLPKGGEIALHHAANQDQTAAARLLLENGADVNHRAKPSSLHISIDFRWQFEQRQHSLQSGLYRIIDERLGGSRVRDHREEDLFSPSRRSLMAEALSNEVRGAQFGDGRLTKRLARIVDSLGAKPTMSVPAATCGRAEMVAAYRFFDNPKVSPENILAPHLEATRKRVAKSSVALLVQDTTELDLTRPKQQVKGAGPIECSTHRGAFFHPLVAFNEDGLPLGVAWHKSWARELIRPNQEKEEKRERLRATPIEEKESIRWVEGIRAARQFGESCPQTECICLADSEADIYEMFSEPRRHENGEIHLLVRACRKRSLCDGGGDWLKAVRSTACLYQCSVDVSGREPLIKGDTRKRRQQRDARTAEVEIRATTVTLRPPPRPDRKLPKVHVNLVLVEETSPPDGETPIQWLLVTSLPIDESGEVRRIISYYCIRWQIEIYFRTLKSGCRVEERQFEELDRLLNCLAVYCIVAWKVMYLCRLGRECPDLNCEVVFEPSEWKAVYMTLRKSDPPFTPPRLNEIIRMVAMLGGYVNRKSTEPGPQTLWLGLQRVHDLSTAWETFGPGQKKISTDICAVR